MKRKPTRKTPQSPSELAPGESHPSSLRALDWLLAYFATNPHELDVATRAMAACAADGNRLAQVCSETLDRVASGKPVGERYVLGLAWLLRESHDQRRQDLVDQLRAGRGRRTGGAVHGPRWRWTPRTTQA